MHPSFFEVIHELSCAGPAEFHVWRPALGPAGDGLVSGEPGLLRGGQVERRHGKAVQRSLRISKKGLNSGQNYLLRVKTIGNSGWGINIQYVQYIFTSTMGRRFFVFTGRLTKFRFV